MHQGFAAAQSRPVAVSSSSPAWWHRFFNAERNRTGLKVTPACRQKTCRNTAWSPYTPSLVPRQPRQGL